MTTVGGLPAHILLVHAVVVLVPLTALALVLVALWPAARRRYALATAALAVVTLVSVPITTDAGEWLERRVDPSPLVRAHTELGDSMLPWAVGLAVVAVAVAIREWRAARSARPGAIEVGAVAVGGGPGTAQALPRPATAPRARVLAALLALVAVVVAVGSVVTVYRIGESGSRAVWTGHVSATPHAPPGGPGGGPPDG